MNILSEKRDTGQLVRCGISTAFHNKENRAPYTLYCKRHRIQDRCWVLGFSFIPTELTLEALIVHILSGGAFSLGYFKRKRRVKKDFVSSQLLGLDFDHGVSVDRALAYPYIRQYAFLVYPTASSTAENPKSRVLFYLSEPVLAWQHWEAIQRGLIAEFAHLEPDPACKDATRIFFGSDLPGSVTL